MRPGALVCVGLAISGTLTALAFGAAPMPEQPTSDAGDSLAVVYFYSPTCAQCRRAAKAVDAAQGRFGRRIRVERHDISELEGLEQMLAYEARYGVEPGVPPRVFVAGQCLKDADAIWSRLETVIREELDRGRSSSRPGGEPNVSTRASAPVPATAPASGPVASATAAEVPTTAAASRPAAPPPAGASATAAVPRLRERFESLRVGTIVVAGLADGINPCAFATIVFLLSAMAYMGKTRRQVAVVGLAFTGAVFVTDLALGLGLMAAVRHFAVRTGLSQALTYAIAALAFLLAGWSFFDGVRALRSGKVPRAALGLPAALKTAIRRVIKAGLRTGNLVLGSLVVGFLVSLLESFCTGQVYVPTILVIVRAGGPDRMKAVAYLVVYNLMFILPLAGIMVAAYFGVRSQRLGQVLRNHLAAFKFAMAALFATLGGVLLVL